MKNKLIIATVTCLFCLFTNGAQAEDCRERDYSQIKDTPHSTLKRQREYFQKLHDLNLKGAEQMVAIGSTGSASKYLKNAERCSGEIEKIDLVLNSKKSKK